MINIFITRCQLVKKIISEKGKSHEHRDVVSLVDRNQQFGPGSKRHLLESLLQKASSSYARMSGACWSLWLFRPRYRLPQCGNNLRLGCVAWEHDHEPCGCFRRHWRNRHYRRHDTSELPQSIQPKGGDGGDH